MDFVGGLPENIAGALAYLFLPAIVFLVVQPFKGNRFVRFHSFQCLLAIAVFMVAHVFLALLGKALPLLALPMFGLLFLAEFTLWLLLTYKAYCHEVLLLPLVGDLAQRWASKK